MLTGNNAVSNARIRMTAREAVGEKLWGLLRCQRGRKTEVAAAKEFCPENSGLRDQPERVAHSNRRSLALNGQPGSVVDRKLPLLLVADGAAL